MKTYIDCGAGVAGDMLLGALVGLGLSTGELDRALRRAIPLPGWSLRFQATERRMWPAWSFQVHRDRPLTSTTTLRRIITHAALPQTVVRDATAIFDHLKAAEATAHRHAHGHFDAKGLGRLDTLVDILGNAWGFWRLGIGRVSASPINTGRISPAARALLTRFKVPIMAKSSSHELATPTGVAILTYFTERFEPMARMKIRRAGYGAGTLELPNSPNVLAIYQGN